MEVQGASVVHLDLLQDKVDRQAAEEEVVVAEDAVTSARCFASNVGNTGTSPMFVRIKTGRAIEVGSREGWGVGRWFDLSKNIYMLNR